MHTREEWLVQVAEHVEPWFSDIGYPLPKYRVTCGWTGRGQSKTTRGQCWKPEASRDHTTEIFISPVIDDPLTACETLLHELVHAAVGPEKLHNNEFKRVAVSLGFNTPMRSTPASDELKDRLHKIIAEVGPYPHAKLDFDARTKQTTRMLKAHCPDCGYTVRVTGLWGLKSAPVCPTHLTVMLMDWCDFDERKPDVPRPGERNVADVLGMLVERMLPDELARLADLFGFLRGRPVDPALLGSDEILRQRQQDSDEIEALKARLRELRSKMQQTHPDRGGDHNEFIELRREYERLRRELKLREQAAKEQAA